MNLELRKWWYLSDKSYVGEELKGSLFGTTSPPPPPSPQQPFSCRRLILGELHSISRRKRLYLRNKAVSRHSRSDWFPIWWRLTPEAGPFWDRSIALPRRWIPEFSMFLVLGQICLNNHVNADFSDFSLAHLGMDLSGGPPLKLQQDIELQDLWVPVTPAKTTSTRKQLASTQSFGQPSGQSWLDPLVAPSTGVLNALPPWELAFQNGSNGSLLGNCVPDRALAIAEASAMGSRDTCFMLNSPSNRCANMGSICWSPELFGNNLVRNLASVSEIPHFAPSSTQIAGEQQMNNTSASKCLLNGKVLLEGSTWSVQKGQYKSSATCLNYLNSFQGTNNFTGISTVPNSVTPLIMEKYSRRTQDEQQALVVSDSVQEFGIEENSLDEKMSLSKQVFDSSADASFSNLMALAHQRAFYKNPESAEEIADLPGELTDKLEGHDIPNERGNEVVELSNSSKQKPRRKKHRPKVVIEGKASRTPKPATPQAKTPKKAQNQESATGKRKYVRRKVAPSFETSPNGLNNNVQVESRRGAKLVRRPLNFDLEEAEMSEKYCAFMSIQNQVKENPVQGACGDDDALSGLRLIKTVDDRVKQGPMVENSLMRFDHDVNSSPSQAVNEFLKQLQHQPQASTSMGKPEVGSLQNNDYSFYLNHAVPKGTKRDNCVIVDAFASSNKNLLRPYNTGDCSSQSQNAEREVPHHVDVHKRMRTENVEFGAASNTVLTYTSQTGWTTINASNSCQELNFDGSQKLIAQKKIHTVEHLIFGEETYGNGYNLLSQGNNLTSNGFMNFNRSPGLLEPSSNITSKPSTLSKPSGHSKRKSYGKRGPRGDKKKGENPPVTPVPSNTIDGATPGKEILGSFAPCVDDMDDIVQKLKWLNINSDHEVNNSQEQNAIVPYAGNSGEMVLYGGNFDQARRRRPRAKVDLDQETNRVWKLLMGKEGEVDQEVNAHKEKWWEEERRVFQGRVDSFIARMHLVQGDRRFSQWKGSVVDSVIGVFLTQNVSDHLSSSAFMALAAKFPLRSTGNSTCSNAEKASSGEPYHVSSEAKATENDSKKESSSSNEIVETATGSTGIDNSNGNVKELHEPEVSFGNESPNSCCGIQVSVTRSVSSPEVEDKRFMEEVVSSHNSVTSSQSSTECQAQSSGYIEPNSVLNVEAQNPLIRSMNDGFGSASFTELLQMAEECRFHKLNDQNSEMFLTMQSSSINCQVTHEIGNNSPVLNQPDNSGSTSQNTPYSLPVLDSQLCHSLDLANTITMDAGSMLREEKKGPLLPSNASKTSIYIKHEVPFKECNELAEENLAESSSVTDVLSDTTTARVIDTYVPIEVQNNLQISSETDIGTGTSQHSFDSSSLAERADATSITESSEVCIKAEGMPIIHQKEINSIIEVESPQYAAQYSNQRENSTNQNSTAALSTKTKNNSDVGVAIINNENFNFQKISSKTPKQGEKGKRRKGEVEKITYDWEGLRKEVCSNKFAKERSSDTVDSLDWEAVRCADVSEIAEVIRERGMNNMLAERIKDFLNRLVRGAWKHRP
ncbi:hypothetical protein HPP92_005761 [Vanilla planifolia]|uniref:Protein ROS1 n=1 Tax=Vanilla planifolia TaxID=51239 RepID=A0A835RUI7_VANPL|nr:hypothetical protein HPP92_005761 [Vanilla planifolia]